MEITNQNEESKLRRIQMFNDTQTIESQLPIEIEGFAITELIVNCNSCSYEIEQSLVHGYANKPLPNTAAFHAVFICKKCRHISEVLQRIKKTGKNTISIEKRDKQGKWIISEMSLKDDHWLKKLLKLLVGRS